jgi:hypothetical protein
MSAYPSLPARRPRHDGWTVERQEAFLKALAGCGCVTHAARAVGMSRQSAHDLYNRPSAAAFRRAFDAALDCSASLVEDGVWSRAINGVVRPIFYKGEQVGEYRHYDERLAMFLLRFRRPHRFGELPKVPPAVPPPGCEDLGPDPDEAVGALEFHLDDLVDEAELPGAPAADSRAIDGVNFVNFVGFGEQEQPADAPSLEAPAATGTGSLEDSNDGDGACERPPRQTATQPTSHDRLA